MESMTLEELRNNFIKPTKNSLLQKMKELDKYRYKIENEDIVCVGISDIAHDVVEYANQLSAYLQLEYDMLKQKNK